VKRFIASLIGFALVGVVFSAIPAQADQTTGTVTITIPTAVSISFVGTDTCAFGTVLAGNSAERLSCLTYHVQTNAATGLSVTIASDSATAGWTGQFSVRRSGNTTYFPMPNSGGGIDGTWRSTVGPTDTNFSDDFSVVVPQGQPAGLFQQHIIYTASVN